MGGGEIKPSSEDKRVDGPWLEGGENGGPGGRDYGVAGGSVAPPARSEEVPAQGSSWIVEPRAGDQLESLRIRTANDVLSVPPASAKLAAEGRHGVS